MQTRQGKTGVLLINLGTPDAPRPREVRAYLREFLSDPLVMDIHPVARWLLLNLVILPFRPRRSARAYQAVWGPEGSPLLMHGRALHERVANELGGEYVVEFGMRYGEPALGPALDRLREAGVRRTIVLPLFPQYSTAATESAFVRVESLEAARTDPLELVRIESFADDAGFIDSVAAIARPRLDDFRPDHLLLSYHGLPESQIRSADPGPPHCLEAADCCEQIASIHSHCYRAQCHATSRALIRALDLSPEQTTTSFQSRLAGPPWIRPFTDEVVVTLAEAGVSRLAVICPAFVADCLETLEEVGIRLRKQWADLGGEDLRLIPCPNSEPIWVRAVANLVRASDTKD